MTETVSPLPVSTAETKAARCTKSALSTDILPIKAHGIAVHSSGSLRSTTIARKKIRLILFELSDNLRNSSFITEGKAS